jgi:exopolysaccharide biosynthesis polyprenyl glycosylphosphotransferase
MMKKNRLVYLYFLLDALSAVMAWTILYVFRKRILEVNTAGESAPLEFDSNYQLSLIIIPAFWMLIYWSGGMYQNVLRRYRLQELTETLIASLVGVLIVFFVLLMDDKIVSYKNYYQSLMILFCSHFFITLLFRLFITSRTVTLVHKGYLGFNTVIIGGNQRALAMYEEIQGLRNSPGFKFTGFVRVNGQDNLLSKHIPHLGKYDVLKRIIKEQSIEEVIIAIESGDHKDLENIIAMLEDTSVNINIIPDTYDILSGSVKLNNIYGIPLIRVNHRIMPAWQHTVKRMIDVVVSGLSLLILSPFLLLLGCIIAASSKGGVLYSQERIGRFGKPFRIYKFRTMAIDAEKNGPQLSSAHDSRVTRFGRLLRKTRLDEIPQFWNVLKGEMALVGPRPERQHFIDLITQRAPHYSHLHRVRPGITSWGQVKYGYAENVDQMIQRLKYDILYIENMSIAMDIKILFYTILIVVKGAGK